MKSGSMAACKRLKLDVRFFQESWTAVFGFVSRDDRAVYVLCCQQPQHEIYFCLEKPLGIYNLNGIHK